LIISASGWRDIFAEDGGAESRSQRISERHAFIASAAASVFADFVRAKSANGAARVIVGYDTRPTGETIARTVVKTLLSKGAEAIFCGITAAPEIMAYASASGLAGSADGFIYISASHNPIGYNGLKFGLTDGGVLDGADAAKLEKKFHSLCSSEKESRLMLAERDRVEAAVLDGALNSAPTRKAAALAAYSAFNAGAVTGGQQAVMTELKRGLQAAPLGIVADFNGSARTRCIDSDFFKDLSLKFRAINALPGEIAHRIVPEGEALTPCCDFLGELRRRDSDFTLGYVPDCDGDRGNIVFFDENSGRVRPLEAQEVFALACLAELCQLVWTDRQRIDASLSQKTAVAVNDATSMRVDRIASAFGAKVFRAETGEANVVGLGRRLRAEGWNAPVMGEGAAGGCIIHPSSARDPLGTVTALLKMLRIRSRPGKKGFFELWLERNGSEERYRDDFTLSDALASLPVFTTTAAYSENARMQISSGDHARLKERYQTIFLLEWEKQKKRLGDKWNIRGWNAAVYNGGVERSGVKNFGEAGRGGLRVLFYGEDGAERASLWMRGSGTEPVFRVMADIEGSNSALHDELLEWHRSMLHEADSA
jgi:phosphoglucomutase